MEPTVWICGPVSTIGAGDNFNAGIIYGLLKYQVRKQDLPTLDKDKWQKIIQCGIDFSVEVCQSYDNYISSDFANKYGGFQVKLK